MVNILDQVARTSRSARWNVFRPRTATEFFALQLAIKLRDRAAVSHYVELVEKLPENHILAAFGRAQSSDSVRDPARRFHQEIQPFLHRENPNGNGSGSSQPVLAAVRVDRRAVAVAIFSRNHLHTARARQLTSAPDKAISSVVGFIERIVDRFSPESAVVETVPNGHEFHRKLFEQAITKTLSDRGIDSIKVPKSILFEAYGQPPVRTRGELRAIASDLWPALNEEPGGPWTHDAAVLGLFVQTERLFTINQN